MELRSLALLLTFHFLFLSGCQTTGTVQPVESASHTTRLADDEERLWDEASDLDADIANKGAIYEDHRLTSYLQSVMNELYPEFQGRLRVYVLKSPSLNAFALPNGSIYFNLGLLATLQNEAQLATILAHEGAHFVHRHSLHQRRNIKSGTAAATVVSIIGIPIVGALAAVSSMYGYSRELEREADRIGWERLVAAGYDPLEAPKTFEHLLAEVEAFEIDEPYFFSSHPKLKERIESYQELAANSKSVGKLGRQRYLESTAAGRIDALQAELNENRYQAVILVLADKDRAADFPPQSLYYLGEAYRRRGDDGDIELAMAAYERCIERAPDYALAYRALGQLHLKRGNYPSAKSYLMTYLERAPDAPDRAYVAMYLSMIEKELSE